MCAKYKASINAIQYVMNPHHPSPLKRHRRKFGCKFNDKFSYTQIFLQKSFEKMNFFNKTLTSEWNANKFFVFRRNMRHEVYIGGKDVHTKKSICP